MQRIRLNRAYTALLQEFHKKRFVTGCRKLLALNPDNHKYHEGLRAALKLAPDAEGQWSDEQLERLAELYDELAKQYPRSTAVQRIPLDFKVGSPPVDPIITESALSFGCSCHAWKCPWYHEMGALVCVYLDSMCCRLIKLLRRRLMHT